MWTTNIITPANELPALIAQGIVSLDMETAAIAKCCEARGIPWSVYRTISDRATDGQITEEVFKLSNQDGTPNIGRVVRFFAKHPNKIPAMIKLAKGPAPTTPPTPPSPPGATRNTASTDPPCNGTSCAAFRNCLPA